MNLYPLNNGLRSRWTPRRGLPVRGTQTGRKRLFFATVLVLVLFIFDALSGGKIRTLVRAVGSSVWGLGVAIEESIYGSGFLSTRRGLLSENSALREQVARLQERAAAYQVLKNENVGLRDILNVVDTEKGENREAGITAPIVSSFRSSPYGTFQVGAGTADSVAPGDIVLSAENFVIGRIEAADSHASLVREIFAPSVSSDAVIRGVGVSVVGQGGGNARTTMPRQSEVAVGDPVVSSVLGARAVGVVGNIAEDSGSAYKSVDIYLPVNLGALQFVYIVKK
ncbi:MAG: rod shape-determining protein MreC [bacterium]|nr:rod shape-determining protein MreC [bacterium]